MAIVLKYNKTKNQRFCEQIAQTYFGNSIILKNEAYL